MWWLIGAAVWLLVDVIIVIFFMGANGKRLFP